MIITQGLTKHFNGKVAVEDLTLEVREGEVFGFLGPNGAGKTTTVRMLCCLIAPTAGTAWVNGYQIGREDSAIRASVGILTEAPGLYERLSAEKNLSIYARLYGVRDVAGQVEKYLRLLGLWDERKQAVAEFSKGMRQKLAIARALIHEPRVLFLDEPTAALDPEAARVVRDFIAELKGQGRTIFLCTHNLDEADRLCDRIAVFKQRLIQVDTPQNLRQQLYGRKVAIRLRAITPALVARIQALPFVQDVHIQDGQIVVALDDPDNQNPQIVRALVEAGADVQYVSELRHSLEEVYFKLIGEA
ncbi:MAG: multidrug ABC transporter ATP-binding protein [Chloroflexota bacterium]